MTEKLLKATLNPNKQQQSNMGNYFLQLLKYDSKEGLQEKGAGVGCKRARLKNKTKQNIKKKQ